MKDFLHKIVDLEHLSSIVEDCKKNGKTVVHCHGVFDLMHPGHIRHFWAAKKQGDVLVVTLTRDEHVNKGPNRPVYNQQIRAESIAALECIDFVAINQWPTAVETINLIRPSVYVKGSDYSDASKDVTGAISAEMEAVKNFDGRIHFTNEITFSSSSLLNEYFGTYPEDVRDFLKQFRSQYSDQDIIDMLTRLGSLRVMIVGESIIDEYHYCQAMGKSPKETIVSTKFLRQESFAGGVLACANHVAGFTKESHLVTILGETDSREDFIRENLRPNVCPRFFFKENARTIVKRRFVEPNFLTKMFEVSFLDDHFPPETTRKEFHAHLAQTAGKYDIVIVTDYGHGLFHEEAVEALCEHSKFLAVNVQTNSANHGFNVITKWPRADYFAIDEPELRLATRNRFDALPDLLAHTADRLQAARATVTQGSAGSLGYTRDKGFCHVPVFSSKVVDRVGAGDAYFSIAALCAQAGYPMDVVGFVGNAVGALAVAIVGNRTPIEPAPLFKFISSLLK